MNKSPWPPDILDPQPLPRIALLALACLLAVPAFAIGDGPDIIDPLGVRVVKPRAEYAPLLDVTPMLNGATTAYFEIILPATVTPAPERNCTAQEKADCRSTCTMISETYKSCDVHTERGELRMWCYCQLNPGRLIAEAATACETVAD